MKIGVTGGIGSGKTTVCKVFNVLGIPVFFADAEATRIMNSDQNIIEKVKSIAGKEVYSGGELDRPKFAALIFNNQNLLREINKIVHPVVFDNFLSWMPGGNPDYVILEAAILFESSGAGIVDKTILVIAPEEERINRVLKRNNLTREQVLERIKNQMSDEEKIRLSDYVIDNSEHEMIIPAILKVHNEILSIIKK
jgi:dephospho-CoA kinase